MTTTQQSVQHYYGEVLKTKDDLKTSACCPADAMPGYLHPYLKNIHSHIHETFYGCGSPMPHALEGCTVLDLGCGTGRDAYILSQLVGEHGKVIGVDMTEKQLHTARKHIGYHMNKFGYKQPNVTFEQGFIEDLTSIKDNTVDVVVSNCVINLSPQKEQVFAEIFRVLKPGGELYFSDIFSDRRIPKQLTEDPILLGECLGGAIYIEDFRRMLNKLGYNDYRIVSNTKVTLEDEDVKGKAGMINFYSMSIRSFKCEFEDICEDYGHVAYYEGTIAHSPHAFILDDHHLFHTGKPVPICGNTAKMLGQTRYAKHFRIEGDFSTHYGAFDCSLAPSGKITEHGGCC